MYGNWELSEKDLPEQFFAFSIAYLDSARRLCVVLKRSIIKATYARGCVVLYLTFHAVELFLKGAILSKSPNEKLNHDIEGYYKRYNNLYPKKTFNFELPYRTEYLGLEPEIIELVKKQQPPPDQLHKYPTDNKGSEWKGAFAFKPVEFVEIIEQLILDFGRIENKILG